MQRECKAALLGRGRHSSSHTKQSPQSRRGQCQEIRARSRADAGAPLPSAHSCAQRSGDPKDPGELLHEEMPDREIRGRSVSAGGGRRGRRAAAGRPFQGKTEARSATTRWQQTTRGCSQLLARRSPLQSPASRRGCRMRGWGGTGRSSSPSRSPQGGWGGGWGCRVLTCETPGSPAGWTWSPPGSAEGPEHSAPFSSSGTRGLWGDKEEAVMGQSASDHVLPSPRVPLRHLRGDGAGLQGLPLCTQTLLLGAGRGDREQGTPGSSGRAPLGWGHLLQKCCAGSTSPCAHVNTPVSTPACTHVLTHAHTHTQMHTHSYGVTTSFLWQLAQRCQAWGTASPLRVPLTH